jgi:glycosyltransferase involved in cell wall biosynthesis
LKLLIGGSSSKFFHLTEFTNTLNKSRIDAKLVFDQDIVNGFPSKKISHWFQSQKKFTELVKEFKPDAVLVDRQRHFGIAALKANLPLFIQLRGDAWTEIDMAKKTLYKSFLRKIAIKKWEEIANQNFEGSAGIFPICKYLEVIVKKHYPHKKTAVMYSGINSDNWYNVEGMNLKHPCVGLLQGAVIWGKTKELLILPKILEALPHVTFYWAGDGPYRDEILSKLSKYQNFIYLGALTYPDQVRQYLSEVDVYGLMSGLDMSPLTLQEAQLMKRPVIATKVGGIPELMRDNETGYLVDIGDYSAWIEKITILLNDDDKAKKMGDAGRRFIEENFSWKKVASDFTTVIKRFLEKNSSN